MLKGVRGGGQREIERERRGIVMAEAITIYSFSLPLCLKCLSSGEMNAEMQVKSDAAHPGIITPSGGCPTFELPNDTTLKAWG